MMTGIKISKTMKDPYEVAKEYYKILFDLNKVSVSEMQLNLISFTAVRGYITTVPSKRDFINKYNTTAGTVNNLVSKLQRRGILVKNSNKIKLHPSIVVDFSGGLVLSLILNSHESITGEDRETDRQSVESPQGGSPQG